MNIEKYADPVAQKYRLVVAVAVLKSKPANLTVTEYIDRLRKGIEKESMHDSNIGGDLELRDPTNTQEEIHGMDVAGSIQHLTTGKDIHLIDRTSDIEQEITESPSILEPYTQTRFSHSQNGCQYGTDETTVNENPLNRNSYGDVIDLDKTFCSDNLDCDKTQTYTVPSDLLVVPYNNLQSNTKVGGFNKNRQNTFEDVATVGNKTFNLEECKALNQSRVDALSGSCINLETDKDIRKRRNSINIVYGAELSQELFRMETTLFKTQESQGTFEICSQKTLCEAGQSQNALGIVTHKALYETQHSQSSLRSNVQKTLCETQQSQGTFGIDSRKTLYEAEQSQSPLGIDTQKALYETQRSQNSLSINVQKTLCESQQPQGTFGIDTQNTLCEIQQFEDSSRMDTLCEMEYSQNSFRNDTQKTYSESQQSLDFFRMDTQKTLCETQQSQNFFKINSQNTCCRIQQSQGSSTIDTQKTLCGTQQCQDSLRIGTDKTPYRTQNNVRTDTRKIVHKTNLSKTGTRAIKKKSLINSNTSRVKSRQPISAPQKFSDSVIEDSENTNARIVPMNKSKKKNLKRPLDRTPKSTSRAENGTRKNKGIARIKKSDEIQNQHVLLKSNESLVEKKVDIIENGVVICNVTTEKQTEITSHKTYAQATSREENDKKKQEETVLMEDKYTEGLQKDVILQEQQRGFEDVDSSKMEEEKLEAYRRIIEEAERDRTPDGLVCGNMEGFVPFMDVFGFPLSTNSQKTDNGATQKALHVENLSSDVETRKHSSQGVPEDHEGSERRLSLTIFEVMHRARCYIAKGEPKDSFSIESGYGSDRRMAVDTVEATIDHTGTALYRHLVGSSSDLDDHPICDSVSEVLGDLVDRLNAEDSRPRFLVEILDKTTSLLQEIFGGVSDDDQGRKEEKICTFLFLNKSLTVLTHTLEKMMQNLERLQGNLVRDSESYEIENTVELENQCYLFHILEILLKRYLRAREDKKRNSESSIRGSSSMKNAIIDVWRNKWCPSGIPKEVTWSQQRTCCISQYKDVLGKIVENGIRSYSLVSFAALQCYNLLHS